MFGNLKPRVEELEREIAALKAELAEVKRTLSQALGENAGLRAENDQLLGFGVIPALRVKRHNWPDYRQPEQVQ
jgi:regulator of replication initiation timing